MSAVVEKYTGVTPSRSQSQDVFTAAVETFVAWMTGVPADINSAIDHIVGLVDPEIYSASTTYNITGYTAPSFVYGSDGRTYVCVGDNVLADNPVGSVTGDWTQLVLSVDSLADYGTKEVTGADITVSGNVLTFTEYSCLDSTGLVPLAASTGETVTIPSVANTIYHLFAVKLVADSSHEIRAYTTVTGVASDSAVSAYRRLDYWLTDGSGNCLDGYSQNGTHWNTKASESAINSATSSPTGCSTELDLSAFIPDDGFVSAVCLGLQATSTAGQALYGFDGTNAFLNMSGGSTNTGDTDIGAWNYVTNGSVQFMPIKTDAKIYWGRGTYGSAVSLKTLLHGCKLRR